MRRREFVTLVGGAAVMWPLGARAQQPGRAPKIGLLWPGPAPPAPPRMEAFQQSLREAGFIEGKNIHIELRYASGGLQDLPDLAADLVHSKVDVIAAFGDLAPRIVQKTTGTIPIVAIADDVLGSGLIVSLARPGGNTTGLTILSPELSAKRLEVLREFIPGLARVASVWDPSTGTSQVTATQLAAQSLKINAQVLRVQRREDLVDAFQSARNEQAEALNVFSSPFLASLYQEIIGLAADNRLPAIYQWREHAEAGGLVSYGPSLAEMWRQSAAIVVKILKGASPADLPVEQPTKFELVVNAKTAKSLGLTIPHAILIRADEVIE